MGGQLCKFYAADSRHRVDVHHHFIPLCRGQADVGLGVDFIPLCKPRRNRVVIHAGHVQIFSAVYRPGQLFLDLSLGFSKHVFDDALTGGGVVACRVTSFPATILALAYVSLTICSLFCHILAPFLTTNTTT